MKLREAEGSCGSRGKYRESREVGELGRSQGEVVVEGEGCAKYP